MELKNYQKAVMADLSAFMAAVDREPDIVKAWQSYWGEKDIGVGLGGIPNYHNKVKATPHICMKVPTGGGKTFMACSGLKHIFDRLPGDKAKVVIWLVPSDSILSQTIRTLSDTSHPYRQRLDRDFAGRVGIYTKEMLLNGQNFSPDTVRDMLTICVLSYASLRINSTKKDVRKVYQENGNLLRFAEEFQAREILLADTPDTALIQVLRQLSPVTVVDESHNAGSTLSVEMLNNLNPSFIMELTATPRNSSNIISYVDARELKRESMVKLPVVVFNRNSRQSVIQDAIQLQANLERQAEAEYAAGGAYIRPIVLFQAQPKVSEDSDTFDKIKSLLVEMGIPKEQIAIKTSKVDDLGDTDLLSQECPIRYIITVNALKEGWDCPFAYILSSLANKTSKVDVEQILGRILRQPYARQHKAPLLNTSYVLTCSKDFHATLDSIVEGLNKSGFSKKDYRVAEELSDQPVSLGESITAKQTVLPLSESDHEADNEGIDDSFEDINAGEVKQVISYSGPVEAGTTGLMFKEDNGHRAAGKDSLNINSMLESATSQVVEYMQKIQSTQDDGFAGGEMGEMLQQHTIQSQYKEEVEDLQIPQFHKRVVADLFGEEYELLQPENLSEGFSLAGQDAQMSFELATGEMYQVDIQEQGEAVPKYKRASKTDSQFIQQYLESLPPEGQIRQSAANIARHVNKNDRYVTGEVAEYVGRIIQNMTQDELAAMKTAIPTYGAKILAKIESLEKAYRHKTFKQWLESDKIICMPSYKLPMVITPAKTIDAIPYSLYEAEKDDMNGFERTVIDIIASMDNIRWWHRNIERKGFCLNGYINHYPDFLVMTKAGRLVLVETKGDYLDGDDSKAKLELGRKWQEKAGNKYRYYMVFDKKALDMDGAFTLDKFAEIMKEL